MNIKELIEKYEYLNHDCFRRVDTSEVLKDLKQLEEPEKPVVPQFVADWIEYCKNTFLSLVRAQMVGEIDFYNYANQKDESRLIDFLRTGKNQETFARAWLDGYEVEKEKKYKITLLNRNDGDLYLINQNAGVSDKYGHFSPVVLLFTKGTNFSEQCYKLTKKEVVSHGFGWVFDCPGVQIEEVID